MLIPWQTAVTPTANKAFSYLESKQRQGRPLVAMINLEGATPINKHLSEDESPRDASPPSVYPAGQTDQSTGMTVALRGC